MMNVPMKVLPLSPLFFKKLVDLRAQNLMYFSHLCESDHWARMTALQFDKWKEWGPTIQKTFSKFPG